MGDAAQYYSNDRIRQIKAEECQKLGGLLTHFFSNLNGLQSKICNIDGGDK